MTSALTSRGLKPGSETNMDADYVIVFRFANTGKAEAVNSFRKLIECLDSVGFMIEVRNGDKHSVLVFAKIATIEHLKREVFRSRTKDWLYGVRITAPDKDNEFSDDRDPLSPAERLRIAYQLLTSSKVDGGAGITPQKGEWANVESLFALHDHKFNREWIKTWASSYTLEAHDLDKIRDMFGEKVAFYFAFTQAYFKALACISLFGFSSWVLLGNFSPIYGLINSLLCVAFIEYWKFQEKELAIRWAVQGISSIETKRHEFIPEKDVQDPVTGEVTQIFPAVARFRRQLLSIPFALAATLALGSLIALCFGIEIFISEVYDGPLKSVLVFLPTGIITTLQPILLGLLTDAAERLTKFENHATTNAYEAALTQKIFVLNFITSYIPIILTAFVYVPFAAQIVPYLDVFSLTVQPFAEHEKQMKVPTAGFHINPDRLKKQVIYFTVTAQILNQILEVVVPFIKQKGFSKYKQFQSTRTAKRSGKVLDDVSANDAPEEKAFLNRVREEAELSVYDVVGDFRQMVVQYGYLALFSIVWPVTSISFLVNDWVVLRADAVKICIESQRPNPERVEGIGPWLDSLEFITWFGSITTAAIAYLFSNGGAGPDGRPQNLQAWLLLLTVFFSEHAYFVVRFAVRKFVSRFDSPGRQKERGERYMVRKQYLEQSMGSQGLYSASKAQDENVNRATLEIEARDSISAKEQVENRFWKRQRGWQESVHVGSQFIESAAAVDSKKKQ